MYNKLNYLSNGMTGFLCLFYFLCAAYVLVNTSRLKLLGEKINCRETSGQLLIHTFRKSGSTTSHWPGLNYFNTLAAHPRSVKPQVSSLQGLQVFLYSWDYLLFLWLLQPLPPNFCDHNLLPFSAIQRIRISRGIFLY